MLPTFLTKTTKRKHFFFIYERSKQCLQIKLKLHKLEIG